MRLGPIVSITVVVHALPAAIDFYCSQAGLSVHTSGNLLSARALKMGDASLSDAPSAELASALDGNPWLQLIEAPHAIFATPLAGWIGLHLPLPGLSPGDELIGPGGERLRGSGGFGALAVAKIDLGCTDPRGARAFYAGLGLLDRFDSAAIGWLQGGQRIEFLQTDAAPATSLRTGIRLVSFARSDAHGTRQRGTDDPSARILGGAEGEGVELV